MRTITVNDGTTIYPKDWGTGPVVTFSHGWPLSADAWDGQLLFLAQNGFREGLSEEIGQAHQGRKGKLLSGSAARPHGHASGSGQRGPARLPPELAFGRGDWPVIEKGA